MKVLLTGVTGYIGKRLLPVLLDQSHKVVCAVRDRNRFDDTVYAKESITVIEVDFLDPVSLNNIPADIDIAYYLIHSMSASTENFNAMEKECAANFRDRMNETAVKQVIYLSGIVNDEKLSVHLLSRKEVENTLAEGTYQLTTLRAGIIVGAGSASFEIIRDLVEKLPVMVAPKWVNTRSQPIAIRNVIQFLTKVLSYEEAYNKSFDIGGPEVLSYKQMLLQFAQKRGLRRYIINVPLMTPRLSSYWLYFVTSTYYKLAVNLVESMTVEVIAKDNDLAEKLGIELIPFKDAVDLAFDKIAQQEVISSWTDALKEPKMIVSLDHLLNVPRYGCLKDEKKIKVDDEQSTYDNIVSIGGSKGWYYASWLWEIRGFLDKVSGGVGLRRGRKNHHEIQAGESLDFWRVLLVSPSTKRLLLYAEMKLPGEAWLEFKVSDNILYQTATFRPKGLMGRVYWFVLLPFHHLIFNGMIRKIGV